MKNLARRLLHRSLARKGKKLVPSHAVVVPENHRVLTPEWRVYERDGVASKHAPAFLRDPEFTAAIEHIREHQLFPPHTSIDMQPTYRLAIAWQLARATARVEGDL